MDKILNIFDYSDYRKYLTRWISMAKAAKISNLSRLAEIAQVHPTFLTHVLNGQKHLSLEQAILIGGQIGHTKIEQDFFIVLINLDRAGNQQLKAYWLEKKAQLELEKNKIKNRFKPHRELTPEQKVIFYSSWVYLAVWACTGIDGAQTLNQIAERLKLNRTQTEEILNFLLESGLCVETSGAYSMGDLHVHISNESPLVVKHHLNWRMKAIQKMDTRENQELFFSAPMSIAKIDFEKIRENLNLNIKSIVEIAKASSAEDLVCLNIDFFKVI